jgi:hypothetical protein
MLMSNSIQYEENRLFCLCGKETEQEGRRKKKGIRRESNEIHRCVKDSDTMSNFIQYEENRLLCLCEKETEQDGRRKEAVENQMREDNALINHSLSCIAINEIWIFTVTCHHYR